MIPNSWWSKKYPYSELFWTVFSRIQTEYGEIGSTSSYSVQMQENTDQNNSEYGRFSRSVHDELNLEKDFHLSTLLHTHKLLFSD